MRMDITFDELVFVSIGFLPGDAPYESDNFAALSLEKAHRISKSKMIQIYGDSSGLCFKRFSLSHADPFQIIM